MTVPKVARHPVGKFRGMAWQHLIAQWMPVGLPRGIFETLGTAKNSLSLRRLLKELRGLHKHVRVIAQDLFSSISHDFEGLPGVFVQNCPQTLGVTLAPEARGDGENPGNCRHPSGRFWGNVLASNRHTLVFCTSSTRSLGIVVYSSGALEAFEDFRRV